jgi:hypothetical protein
MPGSLGANGGVPPSSRQSTVRHSEIAASVPPQPRAEVPGRDRRVRVTAARLASFTCGPKTRPKMTATFSRE